MIKILPIGTDFETIPTQNEDDIESLKTKAKAATVSPPSSYNKPDYAKALELPEDVAAKMDLPGLKKMWVEKFRLKAVDEEFERLYRNTSFSAENGGEIICGAFKMLGTDARGETLMPEPVGVHRAKGGESEVFIINKMVSWLDKVNDYARSNNKEIQFVGANIQMFDLRFLAQRCLINGVKLPDCGLLSSRYDKRKYFDVLSAWTFDDSRASISLDRLCKVLKIQTPKDDEKGAINGGMVWDIWNNDGEEGAARISRYNVRDVAVLEPIYLKMKQLAGSE